MIKKRLKIFSLFAFILVVAVIVLTPMVASAQINLVNSAIWRRIGNVLLPSPANLNLGVATSTQWGYASGLLDQLFVSGRINSEWVQETCTPNGRTAVLSADTDQACGNLAIVEDVNGIASSTTAALQGDNYWSIYGGISSGTVAGGEGMGITFAQAFLKSATNTPVIEVTARPELANATTSLYLMGFASTTGASPEYALTPDHGCFFIASSTRANWAAMCINNGNVSITDTAIASSTTVSGTGQFRRFRLELAAQTATFYIQSASNSLTKVATISGMSVASTTALNPIVSQGKVGATAGLTSPFDVRDVKVWYLNPLW